MYHFVSIGNAVVIDDLHILSASTDRIVIGWDATPVVNYCSTLILVITDSHYTVNESINVTGMNRYTHYSPDPCNTYTFELTTQPLLAGCNNTRNVSSSKSYS